MFVPETVFGFYAIIGGLLIIIIGQFLDRLRMGRLWEQAWRKYSWVVQTQRSILIQILDRIIVDLEAVEVGEALQKAEQLRNACLTAEQKDPNLKRIQDENKEAKPGPSGY